MIRLGLRGAVGVFSVDAGFHGCALTEGKTLGKHFGGDGGSYGGIFRVGIGCFGFGYLVGQLFGHLFGEFFGHLFGELFGHLFGHLFAGNGGCLLQAGTQHAYLDGLLTDGVDEGGDEVGVGWWRCGHRGAWWLCGRFGGWGRCGRFVGWWMSGCFGGWGWG